VRALCADYRTPFLKERVFYFSHVVLADKFHINHLLQAIPLMNEADTCRIHVTPKLQAAGWGGEPHRINEQVSFKEFNLHTIVRLSNGVLAPYTGILEKEKRIAEIIGRIKTILEKPT
jgi:hypothetical protein